MAKEAALAQAANADASRGEGALHGVPIAIKDIIDTHDMPTEHGSPIYKGIIPSSDAACVAMLRRAGAIILGKTVTPEFAAVTPGRTANPHNTKHTPGGSSSGSAAAVADFMVPAAIGTQTVGSTIRPASYCGVVGFMPSHQILPVQGVKVQAGSLDNLGILTRSVADVALVANAILGCEALQAQPLPRRAAHRLSVRRRIGHKRKPQRGKSWKTRSRCCAAPAPPSKRSICQRALMPRSMRIGQFSPSSLPARWLMNFTTMPSQLSPRLARPSRTRVRDALCRLYAAACALVVARRREFAPIVAGYDALLTPAAAGEAPEGLTGPSDLLFQRFWTVLHVPAITLPGFVGPQHLPVGIQLIGAHLEDTRLLGAAAWVERAIQAHQRS